MIGGESPKSDIQNMATLWNPFSEGFEPYKISNTAGKIYLSVSYSFSNFVIDMQNAIPKLHYYHIFWKISKFVSIKGKREFAS